VYLGNGGGDVEYYRPSCRCGWQTSIRSEQATSNAFTRHYEQYHPEIREERAGKPAPDRFIPKPTKRWGPFNKEKK